MVTTARTPGNPVSSSGNPRVGDHVHQLLSLARALVNAASDGSTARGGSTASGGSSASGGSVGVPLGMDVAVLGDVECVQWARDLEDLAHLGQALGVQIAGELAQRVEAGRYASSGVRSPVDMLVQSLKVSAGEAHRRLRLARVVLPVADALTGEVAPVAQTVLGEAFFTGAVSQEMALLVSGFVGEAQHLAHNGQTTWEVARDVEETLVEAGRDESPDFIRHLGNRVISHLDPDGHQPSRGDLLAKQGLFFRKPRRGLIHFDGHMTIAQHEQLMVAIGTATNPNKHKDINTITPDGPDGRGADGCSTDGCSTDGCSTDGNGGQDAEECSGASDREDTQDNKPGQDGLCDQVQGLIGLFTTSPPHSDTGTGANPAGGTNPVSGTGNAAANAPVNRAAEGAGAGAGSVPGPEQCASSAGQFVTSAGQSASSTGQAGSGAGQVDLTTGWRRRLEAWEIPPRPPNAPPEALAPVFEGEQWFWLPAASNHPRGWEPTGQSTDFDIWGTAPTRPPEPPERSEPSQRPVPSPDPGPGSGREQNLDDHEIDDHRGQEPGGGPRVVNGVRIPFPGSSEILDGLEQMDPLSTDPVVKDDRTRAQKLLDGLLDCVSLAARTGKLPLNGGLKTQLIITTTQSDLDRRDGLGTAFTTYN
ncbi:DUF222 domain-containing protein, partial [Arthrobacter sp. H35-D1]|uniref:DUF222 domain-containing protein n=1 Tax=Arthrobacter sp. H35-D1 TaxID=3046202 RepID=UPI0024BB442A